MMFLLQGANRKTATDLKNIANSNFKGIILSCVYNEVFKVMEQTMDIFLEVITEMMKGESCRNIQIEGKRI